MDFVDSASNKALLGLFLMQFASGFNTLNNTTIKMKYNLF